MREAIPHDVHHALNIFLCLNALSMLGCNNVNPYEPLSTYEVSSPSPRSQVRRWGMVSLGHGLGKGSLSACTVAIASASDIGGVALASGIVVAFAATASAVTVAAIDSSS